MQLVADGSLLQGLANLLRCHPIGILIANHGQPLVAPFQQEGEKRLFDHALRNGNMLRLGAMGTATGAINALGNIILNHLLSPYFCP